MDERLKRALTASALGLLVAVVCTVQQAAFVRLGIPPNSIVLDDLVVGLVAGLCAYFWAWSWAQRNSHRKLDEELKRQEAVRERTRIAYEIHDTVAQCFAGMIVNLEAADEFLNQTPEGRKFAERALRMGREGLAETRELVRGLRMPNYAQEGFACAVTHLLEKLTDGTDLRGQVCVEQIPSLVSAQTETQVLRIIREAVTNVVRHAGAQSVSVKLRERDNLLQLCVEDDGCGFGPDNHADAECFGLNSMHERAQHLGGILRIDTQPGRGTRVLASIPVLGRPGSNPCTTPQPFECSSPTITLSSAKASLPS